MEYLLIAVAAFFASGLTLFSGFGLGTILLPVFAIFFPLDIAVALTAVVHFLNNLFKLVLVGKHANRKVIFSFGIPAIFAALAGAYILTLLTSVLPLFQYSLAGKTFEITAVKLVIAFLLMVFALFEIIPKLTRLQFDKKNLPVGGILSGFFGGLSGHQGALRSAFLIRAGLTKEGFIATGVVIACLIDISRLSVYSLQISKAGNSNYPLLVVATLSAFLGAYLGNKLVKKITVKTLQYFVAVMLLLFALLLGMGII